MINNRIPFNLGMSETGRNADSLYPMRCPENWTLQVLNKLLVLSGVIPDHRPMIYRTSTNLRIMVFNKKAAVFRDWNLTETF